MSVMDNITITHFSFGITSMLILFIIIGLIRYFRINKNDTQDNNTPVLPDPTILANNLPPIV